MHKKQFYAAPEAELLVVRFEENIMSPNGSWDNSIQSGSTWDTSDQDHGLE